MAFNASRPTWWQKNVLLWFMNCTQVHKYYFAQVSDGDFADQTFVSVIAALADRSIGPWFPRRVLKRRLRQACGRFMLGIVVATLELKYAGLDESAAVEVVTATFEKMGFWDRLFPKKWVLWWNDARDRIPEPREVGEAVADAI